mmetsp:Transcript_20694/g.30477  ORF Transcript_20694/g.30477 Transcript_20694/m.30477 type:complete len:496 (-) Transcript_20694:313-1800(-)
MVWKVAAILFIASASIFATNAFIANPSPRRLLSSPLFVLSGTNTETQQNSEGKDEAWWKDFELNDSLLPKEIRPDFPILHSNLNDDGKALVYLDSAATSHKPAQVCEALLNYYNRHNSNVHRGAHRLSRESTDQYEASRNSIAKLINANNRNEVIFTSGATEAINLVAYSWGRSNLKPGDEIIVSVAEHHSNIVPWQIISEETGAVLKFIPLASSEDDGTGEELDWKVFREELLSDKTRLVSVQHVSNVLGCINPVDDIVQWTKQKSAEIKILLDGCQSLPHMPVDVQKLNVDFVAASGHKMCGPTGIGFLWGKEELLNSMPPFMGGGEMINDVFLTHSTYANAPGRFEAGTPQIAQAIGLGRAVEYLNGIGMERIEAYEHELVEYFHRRLSELEGVRILGPADGKGRAAVCAFVAEGVHPSDLSTFLDMEGIAIRAGHHCCQPLHRELGLSHSARASLYFYNTKEEIDFFVEKLEETLAFFRSIEDGNDEEGFF